MHSPLIASKYRGLTYTGTMHVVDWLPTLMNAATNGAWSGPLSGKVIDGVDLWDEIRQGDGSGVGRDEIVFYAAEDKAVIQQVGHSLLSRCGFISILIFKLNPPILTSLTLLHLQSPLYSPLHSHPHLAAPSILAHLHPHTVHTFTLTLHTPSPIPIPPSSISQIITIA